MKRLGFFAGVAAVLIATPALAQSTSALAPADQYFGRLKMSILGVRNSLKDLDARADLAIAGDAEHIYDKLMLVENAMHDWQARYPLDPWIPKYMYSLAMVYKKLPFDDAQIRMNDTLDWLGELYPASEFARISR